MFVRVPMLPTQSDDLCFRVMHRPARSHEFLFEPRVLCCLLREFIGMLQITSSVAHLNDVSSMSRSVRWYLVASV